jgi:hypothetical protein
MIMVPLPLFLFALLEIASVIGGILAGTAIGTAMVDRTRRNLILGALGLGYLACAFANIIASSWWLLHTLLKVM